jgi:hypothetical protein
MATAIPPLAKKQLTPIQFGFNLTPVNSATLYRQTKERLNIMKTGKKITPGVHAVCLHILDESNKGSTSFKVPFDKWVSAQEAGIITSDFGEITGALFMLKHHSKEFSKAKFPTVSNQKLVDYYLIDSKGLDHPFSAKAGKGGKASITAVTPIIAKMKNLKGNDLKAATVLAHIGIEEKNDAGKSTGTDLFKGPLLAAEYLKLDSYNELVKVVRNLTKNSKGVHKYTTGIPDDVHLLEAIDHAGKWPAAAEKIKPFLNAAKRLGFELKDESAVARAVNRGADFKAHRDKPWGILHYPITANLIQWLNNPANGATKLLTKAAQTMNVTQVRLYSKPSAAKPTSCEYVVSKFADSKFEFGSPSSTPNPVGNRIGLTMI